MVKVSFSKLVPVPLCSRFLAGNFDLGFLTTRGLLLLWRGGIFWFTISSISQLKKGGFAVVERLETWQQLGEAL
jgi:hypothetical protein